jgi:sugar phosphate isomerase/epimerase
MTRRQLLSTGACAAAAVAAPSPKKIRLGGPIFLKSDDPRELAREHRRLGYAAAYCPRIDIKDKERIKAVEAAYKAENVVIAEVGVWVNLLDADAAKRKENLEKVTQGMALADEVGARCCVDICGSFHEKVWYGPHPKNFSEEFFDASVENAQKIIDAVKPKRAKFAYEMMGWSIPDSPGSYLKLLKAVDRAGFGVHIDVCNGVNSPDRFYGNGPFISECFRTLGQWIVSCHAKDLDWIPEMNVHFVEVVPGRGKIDYRSYLRGVAGLKQDAPLMIEHLKTAEEYAEAAAYIKKVGGEMGIQFA